MPTPTDSGRHDLVGLGILQHTILMDAALMREGVPADDRLVVLHREIRHRRHELRRPRQHLGLDAGAVRQEIVARADAHDDLFKRGVARALTEAVDRAFDLSRSSADASQRVGDGETQIIVAVGRNDDLVHARHARPEHRDEVEIFFRQRIADGIRNIDRRGARLDRRLADPAEIIVLGARCVHRAPLDVVGVARVLASPRRRRAHRPAPD